MASRTPGTLWAGRLSMMTMSLTVGAKHRSTCAKRSARSWRHRPRRAPSFHGTTHPRVASSRKAFLTPVTAAHPAIRSSLHSAQRLFYLVDCVTRLHVRAYPGNGLQLATPILSCVFVSKSLASCRSRNWLDGSPERRLTMRPRRTARRSRSISAQRWTFL
jgi:hypothetical protein